MRLDLKFDPKKTEVSVPRNWAEKGIVKTTYCLVVNRSAPYSMGRRWALLEEQVPLESFLKIDDIHHHLGQAGVEGNEIVKMICILHPSIDGPAGVKDYQERPVENHTAYVACNLRRNLEWR